MSSFLTSTFLYGSISKIVISRNLFEGVGGRISRKIEYLLSLFYFFTFYYF